MNNPYLHTPRLILAPINLAILRALQQGPEAFFDTTSWMLPDRYTEFPESIEYNIELVSSSGQSYPWVGYAVVLKQPAINIGQGGFKSSPTEDGSIEIGYEIAFEFREKGYADEVIKSLLETAFKEESIQKVIAHTLAEKNPSNHLLIKNGFTFEACIQDEEDGLLWKWTLLKKAYFFKNLS